MLAIGDVNLFFSYAQCIGDHLSDKVGRQAKLHHPVLGARSKFSESARGWVERAPNFPSALEKKLLTAKKQGQKKSKNRKIEKNRFRESVQITKKDFCTVMELKKKLL